MIVPGDDEWHKASCGTRTALAYLYIPGSMKSDEGSKSPMRPSEFVVPKATQSQTPMLSWHCLCRLIGTSAKHLTMLSDNTPTADAPLLV